MMCIFLTLFLLMEMTQAIYHIKAKHRNKRHKETDAKPHGKDDKDITRPEEITPYPKFLHFLATDYSTEGAVADPSSSLHKIRHAVSRSVHDGRKRRHRKSKGQRSILVKVLELPVEDPRSLAKFPILPQPDAQNKMMVITETGKILKGIALMQLDMEDDSAALKESDKSSAKIKNDMHKKVSVLMNFLKL